MTVRELIQAIFASAARDDGALDRDLATVERAALAIELAELIARECPELTR